MVERGYLVEVVMVMVSTLDGKITRGNNPDTSAFASLQDARLFKKIRDEYAVYIMGRTTYESARTRIDWHDGKLRIVLTHSPDRYKKEHQNGRVEFTDANPKDILSSLASRGYAKVLLLGGGVTNQVFLRERLVTHIHLTVEPVIVGSGTPLVADGLIHEEFTLITVEKINDRGTLHLTYKKNS